MPLPRDRREKKRCPGCRGTGLQRKKNGLTVRCPVCNGSGEVTEDIGTDTILGGDTFQCR